MIDLAISKIKANNNLQSWFNSYASNHRKRLAHDLANIAARIDLRQPILECGAAPFILTVAMQDLGYSVTGLDVAPERFQETLTSTGIDVVRSDVEGESLPFHDSSFGCVLFNQLFEHLRINPIRTMREVLRVLRPGGVLFLSTPNLRSIQGLTNLLKRQTAFACERGVFEQYEKLETLGHMGHVREYTVMEVCDFLEKTGFEINETIYRGSTANKRHRLITRIFPTFRPQMCVIGTKPGQS